MYKVTKTLARKRKQDHWNYFNTFLSVFNTFLAIISIVLTLGLYDNYTVWFANRGREEAQIKIADEARRNCNFSTALKYYEMIIKKNDYYAPYAALAELEIKNNMYNSANQPELIRLFSIASKSNDIIVLKSCLNFVIEQAKQITGTDKEKPQLFNTDNLPYIKDLVNLINEKDGYIFENMGLKFPVDEEEVLKIFVAQEKTTYNDYHWEYIETVKSPKSNEGYTNDSEKMILVDIGSALVSKTDVSTVIVYTYYKYKKVIDSDSKVSVFEVLKDRVRNKDYPIYLSEVECRDFNEIVDED